MNEYFLRYHLKNYQRNDHCGIYEADTIDEAIIKLRNSVIPEIIITKAYLIEG